MILAIDPGTFESAFVRMDGDYRPVSFGKIPNGELLRRLREADKEDRLVLEMVASYGMAVGREVFDTVLWIGRFWEAFPGPKKALLYRREEKIACAARPRPRTPTSARPWWTGSPMGYPTAGRAGKKAPGWFYGFHADVWQAYAVAVTYADKEAGL